jgi:mRNA interferase MazF
VCGISTQLHRRVTDFDELISSGDEDFAASGLMADSLIRLGFLAVVPQKKIIGSIGSISARRHRRLLTNLCEYLVQGS